MPVETFVNKNCVLIHTVVCLLSLKPPLEFTEVTLLANSNAKGQPLCNPVSYILS